MELRGNFVERAENGEHGNPSLLSSILSRLRNSSVTRVGKKVRTGSVVKRVIRLTRT